MLLFIDDYFITILNATNNEEDEDVKILVKPDGNFEVCAATPPSSPSPSPTYEATSPSPSTQPTSSQTQSQTQSQNHSQSMSQSSDRTNSFSNNPVRKVIDLISISDDDDDDCTPLASLPPIRALSINIVDSSDED